MKKEAVARLKRMLAELKESEPRRAAEVAYALAQIHLQARNRELAAQFGKESIALFDRCKMETEEDCASRFVTLEGVAFPDLIHQAVVRDRLQPLQI